MASEFHNPYWPTEKWYMSHDTFADIYRIIAAAGYGNQDYAAVEISRKYNKPVWTNYEVIVCDW